MTSADRDQRCARGRSTKQAAVLWRELERAGGFVSARELHARVRAAGDSVSMSTVYKRLARLFEDGRVETVTLANGEILYRVREDGPARHRLICRWCGHSVELVDAAIERWFRKTVAESGFETRGGGLKLFGTCDPCGARRAFPRPAT